MSVSAFQRVLQIPDRHRCRGRVRPFPKGGGFPFVLWEIFATI